MINATDVINLKLKKDEMPASLSARARKLFDSGFNCAESVFYAVAQELDLKPGKAQKLATGFGAGIARQGLVCGALSGATMAMGLALGRTKPRDKEAKERVYALVGKLEKDFLKEAGAFNCREITGLDFHEPGDQKRYASSVHRRVCAPLVAFMARETVRKIKKA